MGTRNTLVSGNWAAPEGAGQGLAAQCEELSYYFFFLAAFAGFLAAAFAGFFAAFLAVAILSLLDGPFGCLLASELAPTEVESSPIGNPTQRICHTPDSRESRVPLRKRSLIASPSPTSGMVCTAIES